MRKAIVSILLAVIMSSTVATAAPAGGRGGFLGFIGGCCIGLRAGAAYNDGREIHWREWLRLVPVVGLVIGIWDGIDCASGKTTVDFSDQYGAIYY